MTEANSIEVSPELLHLSSEGLLEEACNAVDEQNLNKLNNIDRLLKTYFIKKIVRGKFEELNAYNSHLVNFLSWFEWGDKPRWDEAVSIINTWKTILELSQLIREYESPQRSYKKLKESAYGEALVTLLYEKKFVKPVEIMRSLNINLKESQQKRKVSKLLSDFEKVGIIVREVEGKDIWISLGIKGMAIYRDYIKPKTVHINELIIRALKEYERGEFEKAKDLLLSVKEEEAIALCLLGIITLERGELFEAGNLFTKASELGLDKGRLFLMFYILEKMGKLESLKHGLFKLFLQRDEIVEKIQPSLHFLALLSEYSGDISRAKEYERLIYAK